MAYPIIFDICIMVKRLFITFLAILYLGASSGATVHYQYCMGRLVNVSLSHNHDKKCHTCGMHSKTKAAKKCCTDKHQQLKSEKGNTLSYNTIVFASGAIIPVIHNYVYLIGYTPLNITYPVSHAPPFVAVIPMFLRNCTFRI